MDSSFLPALNALLNAVAVTLLVLGLRRARRGEYDAHRRRMLGAALVSSLFLVLYVVHKVLHGFTHNSFHAQGALRVFYYVVLVSHLILAMTVPPLAATMITLAVRGRFEKHRRLGRFVWPIWMYVALTGVLIYVLLYHVGPRVE